jgi:hypothetical protein
LYHGGVDAKQLQQCSGHRFAAPNVVYSDEVRDSGFIRTAEGSTMRMPLSQWKSVLAILLRVLAVPSSPSLTKDSRISGDLRDRAALQRRLAQILEDVADFSVRLHTMRTFDYTVKRGNHSENDLDSQK